MERTLLNTIRALDTSDGAGVRLKRALGYNPMVRRSVSDAGCLFFGESG